MPRDQDTEERIFEAARKVLLQRGSGNVRMKDIADVAGINPALLNYYFRSKDRLLEAVFQREARRFIPAEIAVLESDRPLEEKVRLIMRDYLDFFSANPFLPAYVACEVNHRPERLEAFIDLVADVPVDVLAAQIEDAVERGAMRPIDPRQFLANLISLCAFPFVGRPILGALFEWGEEGFEAFIEQRKRELPEFFLRALRPDPEA